MSMNTIPEALDELRAQKAELLVEKGTGAY